MLGPCFGYKLLHLESREVQFLVTMAVTLLHRTLFRQSLLIFSGAWGTLRLSPI